MFKKAYTFDDVALVPKYNNILSRTEPDLSTWLTTTTQIKIPILAANMDTVIGHNLAEVLVNNGTVPILHRFQTEEDLIEQIETIYKNRYFSGLFVSCGIKSEQIKNFINLYKKFFGYPIVGVCLDIAHGHSVGMIDTIKKLKDELPKCEILAGNVCTARAYHDLCIAGADAVKVGVGPGAACTTRLVTGFGVPQFSAIYDCAQVANELRVPLIADGGIRNSRDIVLALAAGASSVMIGKLFALTAESAAEKKLDAESFDSKFGKIFAKYRGQASEDFQDEFYGGVKVGTVPEGDSFYSAVSGTAQELIDQLLGGIRSGLTYGGARSIKELQRKAEFVEVSNTYQIESSVRKV